MVTKCILKTCLSYVININWYHKVVITSLTVALFTKLSPIPLLLLSPSIQTQPPWKCPLSLAFYPTPSWALLSRISLIPLLPLPHFLLAPPSSISSSPLPPSLPALPSRKCSSLLLLPLSCLILPPPSSSLSKLQPGREPSWTEMAASTYQGNRLAPQWGEFYWRLG